MQDGRAEQKTMSVINDYRAALSFNYGGIDTAAAHACDRQLIAGESSVSHGVVVENAVAGEASFPLFQMAEEVIQHTGAPGSE